MAFTIFKRFRKQHDRTVAQRGRSAQGLGAGRLRRSRNWVPAVAFALVLAVIGGVFIWRSFANPLDTAGQNSSTSTDFNQDGKTTLADMSRLLSVYGSQDKLTDLNGDGKVDSADLSILLSRFTAAQASGQSSIAPQTDDKSAASEQPVATPAPTPPPTKPATPPPAAVDTTPPPAQEIANELECPNQTDPTISLDLQYQAVQCMNAAARRFHGLTASKQDNQLMQSALAKAQDVANCEFSHTACGRDVTYWFIQKGFKGKCYAENLGQNQKTVRQVFIQWMESPPHRADILNPIYVGLGVGVTPSSRGLIWVQHFGGCY